MDDVCRSRCLEDKKLNTASFISQEASSSSLSASSDSESSNLSSGPLNPAFNLIQSFPTSSPPSSLPKLSNKVPLHVAAPLNDTSVLGNNLPNPVPMSIQSANALPHELTVANYVLPSPDPSHTNYGFLSHGGSMAWSSGLQPDLKPVIPGGDDLNGSLNPFMVGTTSLASSGMDPSWISYVAPDFGTPHMAHPLHSLPLQQAMFFHQRLL